MSEQEQAEAHGAADNPHWFQRVLDNTWLLLFLGVVVTFVSYTAWGWFELATLPEAKLP